MAVNKWDDTGRARGFSTTAKRENAAPMSATDYWRQQHGFGMPTMASAEERSAWRGNSPTAEMTTSDQIRAGWGWQGSSPLASPAVQENDAYVTSMVQSGEAQRRNNGGAQRGAPQPAGSTFAPKLDLTGSSPFQFGLNVPGVQSTLSSQAALGGEPAQPFSLSVPEFPSTQTASIPNSTAPAFPKKGIEGRDFLPSADYYSPDKQAARIAAVRGKFTKALGTKERTVFHDLADQLYKK